MLNSGIFIPFSSCCQLVKKLITVFMSYGSSSVCLDAAESYKGREFSGVEATESSSRGR